jgi:hypothetical protein
MTAHDAIFAQLPASGEAIAFNHLADALEDLSPDSVLTGLRVLQTEGRAAIAHGFGWFRTGVTAQPDFGAIAETLLAAAGYNWDLYTPSREQIVAHLADAARAGYAARQKDETP